MLIAILFGINCHILIDSTPPTCLIISPFDSSLVSGIVIVQAEAHDSGGIARIDFYADGSLFATETSATATAEWDTRNLPENSWHKLYCLATDLAGNHSASETVNIKVVSTAQRSLFHGKITINNNYYFTINFDAETSKTIRGDARAVNNGKISRFLLLDANNFQKYRAGQPYTALYEQNDRSEVSINYQFTVTARYYVVFLNTTGTSQTYWIRLTLE